MQKLTLPQAAIVGVLNHYQMIERRIAASKAQAQQMKRQPAPELSARQRRKADKARRRHERISREMGEAIPPLKAAFDEGMAVLDEAYENQPLTP